ncbi:unnamed protein product [Parnassius mnemosyne]|uniref:Uncharacterized protein n=1 Tax=Parnassius mnemosyne TaxID=213953 RepID=A0AAV1L1D1_9NEOP
MNQVDQNINKDMIDSDLIDVEALDFSDDQTWLYVVPDDSGQRVDVIEWNLSCDWPINEDCEYLKSEKELYLVLDNLLKHDDVTLPDKHKFDSRTYVKPKKRVQRPSIQSIVEVTSNPPSMTLNSSHNQSANKYLTYNKYTNPLGPILRLKTFNVDTNTENSSAVKEYAMKRRSLVQEDDPQLEDLEVGPSSDASDRLSGHVTSRPINIDLSQPAHNLHNTFNKGLTNVLNERGSLNMYQSGESLMRMSPPSLVSSLLMESSGTFNSESLESRKSMPSYKDSGLPTSGRDSIDPMMTSMTLSILDEKDMSTSFLSQTTYPDNDSLLDSLPPSLVSSVNSSYVVNTSKTKSDTADANIFSSATFTHLEQSERLLSARPRCQLYNSFTKRDSGIRNTESYTKSREEACQSQINQVKVLNENTDKVDAPKLAKPSEMSETITLHYSNSKYKHNDAEKENLNETFKTDDAFFKDNYMQKTVDSGKNILNMTLDKQELNEIKQARQKLSLARKGLPTEPDKPLPNQVDTSPIKTIQLPNQIITVPRQSMENVSEALAKRRSMNLNNYEKQEEPTRETPKRNATFRKVSPKHSAMDTTVVYVKADENQMIDINSATMNLIDAGEKTLKQDEWGSQERAMVGSSESTDTGTFSSSSPPDSVPDTAVHTHDHGQIASTPLMALKKGSKSELLNLHTTISPIYDMIDDKSYTLMKAQSSGMEQTYNLHNTTVINSATMVKKNSAKRDILAGKTSPEQNIAPGTTVKSPTNRIPPTNIGSYSSMAPPTVVPRKTGLPTSKLRQYSSHKELNRIPGGNISGMSAPRTLVGRTMVRRGVYASNPALSPTAPTAPAYPTHTISHPTKLTHPSPFTNPAPPIRRDSYTVAVDQNPPDEKDKQTQKPSVPALVRQGTETLRRERPQSQLVAPRDLRTSGVHTSSSGVRLPVRNHYMPPPSRAYSIAGATQTRVSRPTSVPTQRPVAVPVSESRLGTGAESRVSALPRPSRLPAPRRGLRPPSVYSVAPTADVDHY